MSSHLFDFFPDMFHSLLELWVLNLQTVSGVGSLSWHRFQDGPIIAWSLSQFLGPLITAHPEGSSKGRSKVLWLSLCPISSTGSLPWLQKIAGSGSISLIARSLS